MIDYNTIIQLVEKINRNTECSSWVELQIHNTEYIYLSIEDVGQDTITRGYVPTNREEYLINLLYRLNTEDDPTPIVQEFLDDTKDW